MKGKNMIFIMLAMLAILFACSNPNSNNTAGKAETSEKNIIGLLNSYVEEKDVASMAKEIERIRNEKNITDGIIEISDSFIDTLLEEKDFDFLTENYGNISIINSISKEDNKRFRNFLEDERVKVLDEMREANADEDYLKVEEILIDNALLKEDDDDYDEVVKSYIAFLKSDEPMSLRTAKLMDSVDFEYSGILSNEIEKAIYSRHEEGSLISDTFAGSGRSSYDYLDWKYNDSKTAYEKAKNYKELAVRVEIEKVVKENLIEQAKGQNPHLGMTKEEVEASLWGLPEKINRTVTQYSEREQWVYGNRQYLYFTDGILTSFQD